jgi:hypothetical protein
MVMVSDLVRNIKITIFFVSLKIIKKWIHRCSVFESIYYTSDQCEFCISIRKDWLLLDLTIICREIRI